MNGARVSGMWKRWVVFPTVFLVLAIAMTMTPRQAGAFTNLSPAEVREWRDTGADIVLLDIREFYEWAAGHIPDAVLMPWNSNYLSTHYDELPDKPIIVYCRSGNRSVSASIFLESKGLTGIYNMTGGINSWVTLPPPSPVNITTFSFDSSDENWTFNGPAGPFDVPATSLIAGGPGLSPMGSSNCFSFWYSPDVAIENNKWYRSTWTVGSTATDPDDTPQFRLRVNQKNAWSAWERTVNSNLSNAPYIDAAKDYDLYFYPRVTGADDEHIVLSFDIMNFDDTDDAYAEVILDELTIEQASAFTSKEIKEYDFSGSTTEWTFKGSIPPYDAPVSGFADGRLEISPGGSAAAFSYWESPDVQIAAGKVYRAVFEVGSTVDDPDNATQFRLRVNQKGAWSNWARTVSSAFGNAPSASEPAEYSVVVDPGVTGTSDNDLVLAFDLLSFDAADDVDSWLYLNKVFVEEITFQP